MFPITSTLSTPAAVNFPLVNPTPQTAAVNAVNGGTLPVGTATDAPPASVTIDLSPVASFLLTVSRSQQQIAQLQAGRSLVQTSQAGQDGALRSTALNDATQEVVDAFNLLPGVSFNQSQPQSTSLLNNLVNNLTRQAETPTQQTAAQNLAQIGVTLQPPLLSDATGGLSLDNEILRSAFNSNEQSTTDTLQNTLTMFRNLATEFAEQVSAAASTAAQRLQLQQQEAQPLSAADQAQNARLDFARAQLDVLAQSPLAETAADRLAAQRAALEQPLTPTATAPQSPIINPQLQAQQDALGANAAQVQQTNQAALAAQQQQAAQADEALLATQQTPQSPQAVNFAQLQQAAQAALAAEAQVQTTDPAQEAGREEIARAASAAAQASAQSLAARQQSTAGLNAASAASAQAATQAQAAQNAASNSAPVLPANASPVQQAQAAQTAAANLVAANAAAATALAQAQAAQNAADALVVQNAQATAAAAEARAAQLNATSAQAANAAAAVAAQQSSAAETTATNLAAANAAAADAAQQARAAQAAAAQAAAAQANPLQGNPALAAAIAAYNINDPMLGNATARAPQSSTPAVGRVAAVTAAEAARTIGSNGG